MKNIIIEANDLCKSYANNGMQNHVLNHIDLEIYDGDFTVIMGSSGSGKSTLLYTLSGMDQVTSGEVWYKGEDITKKKEKGLSYLRRKDFGFKFQQIHLVSNLSLFENVSRYRVLIVNEFQRARENIVIWCFSLHMNQINRCISSLMTKKMILFQDQEKSIFLKRWNRNRL